jgi:prophage tail gpP-like protein
LGGLVITRAGKRRLKGKLELGSNIKVGRQKRSARERFSRYTVKAQSEKAWTDTSSVSATVEDKAVKRYRPKIILADNAVDTASCKALAIWHRNVAAAKSQAPNYTFLDWYLDGELLEPGVLVPVLDPYLKINRDMLIVTVIYIVDDQGLRAELTLALPDAFDLTELPETNDDGGVW